jgi:hypothetical protein
MENQESMSKETLVNSVDDDDAKISSKDKLISSIEKIKAEIIELSDLLSVENNTIDKFFSILNLMSPILKWVSIDVSVLPKNLGKITKARVTHEGNLVLYKGEDQIKILDLYDIKNRELLIIILNQLVPKLKQTLSPIMITESEPEQHDRKSTIEKKHDKPSKPKIKREHAKKDEMIIDEIDNIDIQEETLTDVNQETPSDIQEPIQLSSSKLETPIDEHKTPNIRDEQISDDNIKIAPSQGQIEKEAADTKTIHTTIRKQRKESFKEIQQYRNRVKTETHLTMEAVRKKKHRILVERGIIKRLKSRLMGRQDH